MHPLMDKMMGFVRKESWKASLKLGKEKGVFPEFEANREAYTNFLRNEIGIDESIEITPRNYEVTTIAPTGTISLVAEGVTCRRKVMVQELWAARM